MRQGRAALAAAFALLCAGPGYAHDTQSMQMAKEGDPSRDNWYKSLRDNHYGTPCCDLSDGHQISLDSVRQDGEQWFVNLPAVGWVPVPADRVVRKPLSIDGQPYLFMAPGPIPESPNGIRCFIPPIPGY